MVMDSQFNRFPDSRNDFKMNQETILPTSHPANGVKFKEDVLDLSFMDLPYLPSDAGFSNFAPSSSNTSPDGGSPSDDSDSDVVLKYISQILMEEEEMEEKPCMLRDSLALHAAEKSFYEVLGEKPPSSSNQQLFYQNSGSPNDIFSGNFSDYSSNSSTGNSVDPHYVGDLGVYGPSLLQTTLPVNFGYQSTSNNSTSYVNGLVDAPLSALQVQNFFSDSESAKQFRRGVEEASKFLPSSTNLIIDLENYTPTTKRTEVVPDVVIKAENRSREHSPNGSRGRKRENMELEDERINKQSAVYEEEVELSEMFDKVLLCNDVKGESAACSEFSRVTKSLQPIDGQASTGVNSRAKKQSSKKDAVDLRTLLILCAQSVSADDHRTASELLKQIRQHSSPFGDGSQRLAHCFANCLEARLAGTGAQIYTALASKKISTADILKAYQVYIHACPFKKISIFFANQMIMKAAENAKTLHIVDFGIHYGFQWPILIQCLSSRSGGPPKLRITGIELPQPGFRPAERVEETGRRLEKYCKQFNVPFEYNAIAQKWETIRIEDLKIERNEVLAVNTLYRFKNLLDETVVVNSPRNAVLNLIRKMNPNIFVHSVVNGSYNAPFFVTRFREALFHFSALYDMFDTNISRDIEQRLMFEQEIYGREAMNVIACEGSERVERPETYKQWQVRDLRAGFRLLPLDPELMKKLRNKLKKCYHKDFVVDEDGRWMLLGWKGRIVYASSCWVPA